MPTQERVNGQYTRYPGDPGYLYEMAIVLFIGSAQAYDLYDPPDLRLFAWCMLWISLLNFGS